MTAKAALDDQSAQPAEEERTFEDAVRQLEALVSSLEGGELGLEASITAYEEGLKLARSCIERLDAAELRVQELSELTDDLERAAPAG